MYYTVPHVHMYTVPGDTTASGLLVSKAAMFPMANP